MYVHAYEEFDKNRPSKNIFALLIIMLLQYKYLCTYIAT